MAKSDNANYLAENMPEGLKTFILKCRSAMANPAALPALIGVVKHAKDVPTGIAMFIMGIVNKAEQAMGPLNDKELRLVLAHLAGTVIEIVEHAAQTDPASMAPQAVEMAKDKKTFFQAIMFHCLEMVNKSAQQAAQQHAQGPQDGPQGDPQGQPPQGPQEPPQGPPQGAQGQPQGQPQQPPPLPPQSVLAAMRGDLPSNQARSVNFLEHPTDGR